MPELLKTEHAALRKQLIERCRALFKALQTRELRNNKEGAGRGYWRYPEAMCVTKGSALDIRLAADDFKNILVELRKLK